jgi:2-isopropylmalate synthase
MTTPAQSEADRVVIFDTTLRDGEQSPGATMTHEEKLEIAEVLDTMGVDIIEAGFPIASEGDFQAVNEIARRTQNAVICGLARAGQKDVDRAGEAIKPAKRGRIHTFLSTSPVHMKWKLQKEPHEVYEMVVASVTRARKHTDDVEWSSEDGTRTEHDFLCRCVEAAINAGATTINIPDTVGYTVPEEYFNLIRMLRERVPNSDKARFSAHCHDDLGMAVANSLAGVRAGIRQIECTINGIGERAGNAALEELVMVLKTRPDYFKVGTRIDATKIFPTSRMVSTLTGLAVQRNKAIVGQNAFAHESGIHQDGVLKYRETYEIMNPASVGIPKNTLVLGKHSGRAAFKDRIATLGYDLTDEQVQAAFTKFKTLADKKKEVFDEDIESLVDDQLERSEGLWELVGVQVTTGSNTIPTATVTLRDSNGETVRDASIGDGPVDAIYSAIQRLTGVKITLTDYRIRAVSRGIDAQGEVQIEIDHHGSKVRGRGVSTDILEASALAYLAGINRMRSLATRDRQVTQHSGV